MRSRPTNNIVYVLVFGTPPESSMSCSSHLDALEDERCN